MTAQDIVLIVHPPEHPPNISPKGGYMALNRFCIDEELAFESSGVFHFNSHSLKTEGKGKSFLHQ